MYIGFIWVNKNMMWNGRTGVAYRETVISGKSVWQKCVFEGHYSMGNRTSWVSVCDSKEIEEIEETGIMVS